jgi:hypothetical protein
MKLDELFPRPQQLPETLDSVFIRRENLTLELLEEGKWVTGRFERSIRIDHPTHLHGDGQVHAHVLGRKGDELGVVNFDGTASHGSRFKLHDRDANALRALGFDLPPDNIVEWILLCDMPALLFG